MRRNPIAHGSTLLLVLLLLAGSLLTGCSGSPSSTEGPNVERAEAPGPDADLRTTYPADDDVDLVAPAADTSPVATTAQPGTTEQPAEANAEQLAEANAEQPAASETAASEAAGEQTEAEADARNVAVSSEPGIDPLDWPYWRGPAYDGTSPEFGLVDDFDPDGGEGSNVNWKRDDLGGRSTPIVMHGKLFTLVRDKPGTAVEGEKVVCIDADSGETLWENTFNVWLSDVPDTRVGWSSVVGDPTTGRVYALGVSGYFQCIDSETGETVWSVPLHEQFGLLSTYGGRTNFPVICDDLVIISGVVIGWGDMAKPAHRFLAFDKATGEVVWFNGTTPLPYDTTYSSPTVTVLDGQKAIVFGSGDGAVWAMQPRTGKPIWHYPFSRRGLNVAPLVVDQKVYTGHSEENVEGTEMGAVVALDGTGKGNLTGTEKVLWQEGGLMMGKAAPVLVGDQLWCFDDRAKLHILDAKTGEILSRKALGTMMRASPLYADGKIYALTANGRWYIIRPDNGEPEILSKGRMPRGEECHASPIVSHGKIYIQTTGGLYCLEDKQKEHGAEERPAPPQEVAVSEDQQPAHVQIVPAEVLMQTGRMKQFKARLFNAKGQFLKEAEAEFSVEGPGQISPEGTFLAAGDSGHQAATVVAKVGDLTGRARVRIVPPLPWAFDFDGLDDPPVTWVGARYRHVIREVDGNYVMVKISTIPKGTRSRAWFGPPELHDYTIQAEVRGALSNDKMPDIGLIAQGYAMDMQGANQALQIRSWIPHETRREQTVDFDWKPETWYIMKLQASNEEGKAVLRGKVWPRGEDEPADWTIELTDERPNVAGSPGLFGNAKDAEIFLDNILVTPN